MRLPVLVLALVSLQRFLELLLAGRNTRRLLAAGGREAGAEHYPLIVLMHAAWLSGLWILGWRRALSLPWLTVFIVLQGLRVWIIASLGGRWTTRIIVVAGAPLVRKGPYRWVRHPNYLVVAGEIAVLPLALGLPLYAAAFSLANAVMMWIRIRAEGRALAGETPTPLP